MAEQAGREMLEQGVVDEAPLGGGSDPRGLVQGRTWVSARVGSARVMTARVVTASRLGAVSVSPLGPVSAVSMGVRS
jgi:hypothetical protein